MKILKYKLHCVHVYLYLNHSTDKITMDPLEYVTGNKSYPLREFFENYKTKLPLLVKVEQGYCGDIGFNTFDRDEVSLL